MYSAAGIGSCGRRSNTKRKVVMSQAVCCRALLVGYGDVHREVLRRLLRACDCEAHPVATPQEAEAHLGVADRLFIDYRPGDRHVARLLRTIRERDLSARVALTVSRDDEDALPLWSDWRPDAVFVKPLHFPSLAAWLKDS
jgi:CheY-like chemotaxis protein